MSWLLAGMLGGVGATGVGAQEGAREFVLAPSPSRVLGGMEGVGPEEFSNVVGVDVLPDGSIVVGDAGSSEVRVFHPDGRPPTRFGGFGRGPGEIPGLWQTWARGGSIIVQDVANGLHGFTVEGEFIGSRRPGAGEVGSWSSWSGVLEGGWVVGMVEAGADATSAGSDDGRPPLRVLRVPLRGDGAAETVATGRGRERQGGLPRGSGLVVFSPGTHVAVFEDRVCHGDSAAPEVTCVSGDGRDALQVSLVQGARAVNDEDREAYLRGLAAANPGNEGELIRWARDHTRFAERMPHFGRLVAGDDGTLWVRELIPADETQGPIAAPDRSTVWRLHGPSGEPTATLTLPPRFRLMAAGTGWVAGVLRDGLDVESVVVWEFGPSG